jgi:hypothetical protein
MINKLAGKVRRCCSMTISEAGTESLKTECCDDVYSVYIFSVQV